MIRANLPAAMQGLVVVPLFAGYDQRRGQGRLWKFDVTGGRYEETDFEATGSGGIYARESLKKSHRADASRDQGLRMAVQALVDAADEDRATGGIDVVRGIFPLVDFGTSDGITRADDSEIEQVYREIVGRHGGGDS
jgi:proteasome beta subunit